MKYAYERERIEKISIWWSDDYAMQIQNRTEGKETKWLKLTARQVRLITQVIYGEAE